MSESEIKTSSVELEKDKTYLVAGSIFNVTILQPAPAVTKGQVWYWHVGNVDLEKGDELVFRGSAEKLKIQGDTSPENLIFKSSRNLRKRENLSKKDILSINPVAKNLFNKE